MKNPILNNIRKQMKCRISKWEIKPPSLRRRNLILLVLDDIINKYRFWGISFGFGASTYKPQKGMLRSNKIKNLVLNNLEGSILIPILVPCVPGVKPGSCMVQGSYVKFMGS